MIKDVIIMGLDKRENLWRDLEKQCLKRGWDTKVFVSGDNSNPNLIYDYIDPNPCVIPEEWKWGHEKRAEHHYKAFLTHKAIIKYAIKNNLDHFLLLEDDSTLVESRFDQIWNRLLPEIEDRNGDWDFVFLGGHYFAGDYVGDMYGPLNLEIEQKYKEDNANCYLMYVQNFGGFFGVLINKHMYPKLLSLPPVYPIDCQLNRMRSLREINSFNILPSIVYPKHNVWSFCEQKMVPRDILE